VSKLHSSTFHPILNPETGAINPQYHCVFDDTFNTVWADGNFDPNVWENLLQQPNSIERHYSTDPDANGTITLPPDFIPFSQDIDPSSRPSLPNIDVEVIINNNNNNNNNNEDNNDTDTQPTPSSPSPPLLSRQIFSPTPSSSSTPFENIATPPQRHSTRSNFELHQLYWTHQLISHTLNNTANT
jgi:hypothetical protein